MKSIRERGLPRRALENGRIALWHRKKSRVPQLGRFRVGTLLTKAQNTNISMNLAGKNEYLDQPNQMDCSEMNWTQRKKRERDRQRD